MEEDNKENKLLFSKDKNGNIYSIPEEDFINAMNNYIENEKLSTGKRGVGIKRSTPRGGFNNEDPYKTKSLEKENQKKNLGM